MKVVNVGNQFTIHDSTMRTFDAIPAGTYTLEFSKMTGFYLQKRDNLSVNETVYGNRMDKVDKVLYTFTSFDRSLGVILSGDKGIGKSMFSRLLCTQAVRMGTPVIVVSAAHPDLASFIDSIDQRVLVLFDEFDKMFSHCDWGEDEPCAQSQLLSLFDGISGGKKLYVITCNNINSLSEYMLNRPGRFHYHFRFSYPSADEIRTYMEDKLEPAYFGEINAVIEFSIFVPLNYDCLRAIAFELNTGLSFKEAIRDLNIVNTQVSRYVAEITFSDGRTVSAKDRINFFADKNDYIEFNQGDKRYHCRVHFNTKNFNVDLQTNAIAIRDFKVNYRADKHEKVVSLCLRPDVSDYLAYPV